MSPTHTGVWVTGPSRSGTSLVAGLLRAHGVYFGTCISANEYNPKGFFENVYLKAVMKGEERPARWPAAWFSTLEDQGWDRESPWGVKVGPEGATLVFGMRPTLGVICRRPIEAIARSRGRVHWATGPPRKVARGSYRKIERAIIGADFPVLDVDTDDLVAGDRDPIRRVLANLELDFDESIAREWIDPSIWNRGGG